MQHSLALDAELEARANGYASNVVQSQKELDLAKKNQEKALKERTEKRRNNNKLLILVQASSLITASANLLDMVLC